MNWYVYTPADTLFLRGAEPMLAGMDFETVQAFPPAPSVISGAMRTAVLSQREISINQYKKGNTPVDADIGHYGSPAPFSVFGFALKKGDNWFFPAPYSWVTSSELNGGKNKPITVDFVSPLPPDVSNPLGMCGSYGTLQWARHNEDVRSIGGMWIRQDALQNRTKTLTPGEELCATSDFLLTEERTGIGLGTDRRVKEGKLYTGRHLRLKNNVSLAWAIDKEIGLADQGILSLGGEQRFGQYVKAAVPDFKNRDSAFFMATTFMEVTAEASQNIVAAGKIVYRGGWDLARQFHRPMVGYYPAGSVFSQNVNNNCMTI